MNMLYFAHAADQHTESTTNAEHLLTEPLVSLPLFIGGCLLLYIGLTKSGVKLPNILLIFMGVFLIVGVLGYEAVPILSILSLSLGTGVALFFALTSITK